MERLKNIAIYLMYLLVFGSCKSLTGDYIQGKWSKVQGSGGAFENAYLMIIKIDESNFKIQSFNSNNNLDWEADTKYEPPNLTWTDKGLPMSLKFNTHFALLKAGNNGEFGKYTFANSEEGKTAFKILMNKNYNGSRSDNNPDAYTPSYNHSYVQSQNDAQTEVNKVNDLITREKSIPDAKEEFSRENLNVTTQRLELLQQANSLLEDLEEKGFGNKFEGFQNTKASLTLQIAGLKMQKEAFEEMINNGTIK